jgi:hypothetical protein
VILRAATVGNRAKAVVKIVENERSFVA